MLGYESDGLKEQGNWEQFVERVLCSLLIGKQCFLVTDTPQSYSLVYSLEIEDVTVRNANKIIFSIVEIGNITEALISSIVGDEEFERGLLWFCQPRKYDVSISDISVQTQLTNTKEYTPVFNSIFESNDGTLLFFLGEKDSFLTALNITKENFPEYKAWRIG